MVVGVAAPFRAFRGGECSIARRYAGPLRSLFGRQRRRLSTLAARRFRPFFDKQPPTSHAAFAVGAHDDGTTYRARFGSFWAYSSLSVG